MDNIFNNKQPCFVRWHWVNGNASSVMQEANNRLKSIVFLRWILLLMPLFCCLQPAFATPTTPTSDFIDNKDGTVTHKTTGLTWMRCSMGQTWTGLACSGTASTYTYDTAIALKSNFAGHSDWRLPNIAELQTIVERENINPAINTAMFPNINIPTNGYSVFWSSSPLVETTKEAWTAYFYDGTIINNFRWDSFSVRLVRASQSLGIGVSTPNNDFTDNKDGTVTHKRTGLVWQRCSVGQTWTGSTCSGTASTYTYDQAIALNSTFAGHSDWHVPNANELASIVKYNAVNPTINTTQFPNTPSNDFWSSSPYVGDTSHAWSVAFSYGDVYGSSRDSSLAVRLVHASRLADSTPALAWKKSSTLTITHTPSLGTDGRFYASAFTTSGLHGVAAFNATDGSVAWGPIIPSGCTAFGSEVSVGVNGLLYGVGDWNQCGDGRLVAFNASNGNIAWTHHDCGPHPRQTPALNDALNSVYFGSSALCSVDMNSGIDNWNIDGGYYIGAKGIAIDSSNNIYYGTHSGAGGNTLIQSITSGGVFRWERGFLSPAQDGPIITGMFSEDTTLLQYAATGDLLVWDNNGNDLWQAGNLERPVTDKARNIYASSRLGADVVSLNSTGSERWRRTLPGATWARMDFVDNTGHVYARGNNVLYQLNSADGSIAWSFAADADLAVGAALTRGGRIFLSDMDANLYLLDTQLNYSISAWPVAEYGDGRHTEKANSANFLSFPVLSITPPPSKDFGIVTVGSTKDMEFRINNTGKGKLKGTASTSTPFSIVSGGSFSLTAGTSQAVVVSFSPTTAGSFSGHLRVTSNGGNASPLVTGTGAAPAINVTPTSLSFGSVAVGNSADRSFTIQNTGSGTLAGTCNTASPFSLPNGCSFSLSAGQSQTINVHFSPATIGTFIGNVSFTSNGGNISLAVTGTGDIKPPLTISSIRPTSGIAGTPVTINGKKFGATQGSSFVSFGSTHASIKSWSDTQIVVVTPSRSVGTVQLKVNTSLGTSNSVTFTYFNSVKLNIERPPLKEKQNFNSLGGLNPQLELEFLEVAKSELFGIDNNAVPGDECYLGAVDAVVRQQANRLVKISLNKLAADVFSAAIGTLSTGSIIGDYLLKLATEVINASVLNIPLNETLLTFVTEKTVGYVAGNATQSFILGETSSALTEKTITNLLNKDKPTTWNLSGNNRGTEAQVSHVTPLTKVTAQLFYNPWTHYTTALISATCNLQNGTRKNLYIQRYEVEKTQFGGAKLINGTLKVASRQLQ